MRISSNKYQTVMQFALKELKDLYPSEEVKAMMYWLFEDYLGVDKTQYLLDPQRGMSESELLKFNFAIKDLKKGKPIQYILGYAFFHGLKIYVNEHTLIPRPETEELVQWIFEEESKNSSIINSQETKDTISLKILDMCTGTACIPVALQNKMPEHQYYGADFKTEILDLANRNALLTNSQIVFFKFDLLNQEECDYQFDIIVSNPPYVLESDKLHMHQNVLDFEPESALYVDNDQALLYYEKILELAQRNLKPSGRIYFEIHEKKSEEIEKLLQKNGYKSIGFKNDFRDKIRFVKAEK